MQRRDFTCNYSFSVLPNTVAHVPNQLSKNELEMSICSAVIAFLWHRFEIYETVDVEIAVNKFLNPIFLPPKQLHPELSISTQFLFFFVPHQI